MKTQSKPSSVKQVLRSKPFIALKTSSDVIKFISVFEVSKIVINKSRLEIDVLLVNGDVDSVRFNSPEELEDAFKRLYTAFGGVFLAP